MTSHAILSPSSAGRWFRCPGSLYAAKDVSEIDTSYSKEGATAHALAEFCLKFNKKAIDSLGKLMTPNGIYVDDEMVDAIQEYVDTVNGIKASMSDLLIVDIEQKLDFTDILDIASVKDTPHADTDKFEAFGTADAVIVGDGELQIHDLKYGKGVQVYAEENTQLLIYALAAYQNYSLCCEITKISVHIHQPRRSHYSEYSVTPEELLAFGEKLKEKAIKAYTVYLNGPTNDDDFCAGESQCRFCKPAGFCEALAKKVTDTIGVDFDAINDIGDVIIDSVTVDSPEDLAVKYKALNTIKLWINAIDTRVNSLLQQGQKVPGYKLVIGRQGNRAWRDVEEAENALKTFKLKEDERYTKKLISPTQALKLLKDSPKRIAKLEGFITRPEGKPTVVPESDKRPAINIADDFNDLTQEEEN